MVGPQSFWDLAFSGFHTASKNKHRRQDSEKCACNRGTAFPQSRRWLLTTPENFNFHRSRIKADKNEAPAFGLLAAPSLAIAISDLVGQG
jgi:hypothetical protein